MRTTFRKSFLRDVKAIQTISPPVRVTTGSGNIEVQSYVLHDLRAFGQSTGPTTVLAMDLPEEIEQDGILGMDFLSKLKMTIDFPNGTIRMLKPTKPRKRRK